MILRAAPSVSAILLKRGLNSFIFLLFFHCLPPPPPPPQGFSLCFCNGPAFPSQLKFAGTGPEPGPELKCNSKLKLSGGEDPKNRKRKGVPPHFLPPVPPSSPEPLTFGKRLSLKRFQSKPVCEHRTRLACDTAARP